jgi:class 3 adenylate cyclase
MPSVRRLTAILAADVAGYSRLMGVDEEGTHERLKAHLREVIEPKIAEHRGRIVKNTGDGFLAEFQSVVDAVRSAVEMQRGVTEPVCCNGLDDPRMAWLPPKAALAKLREEVEIAKGLLALCDAQPYRGAI